MIGWAIGVTVFVVGAFLYLGWCLHQDVLDWEAAHGYDRTPRD